MPDPSALKRWGSGTYPLNKLRKYKKNQNKRKEKIASMNLAALFHISQEKVYKTIKMTAVVT